MPKATPTVSASQSPMSALRLNAGCMSSMRPPKALAPMKTATSPRRPVRASGKASAANAMKCTSLSLPSGAGGGASRGQSMARVRVMATKAVRGMSRYLRMGAVYGGACPKPSGALEMLAEMHSAQLLMCSDKAMFRAGDFQIPSIDFPYQARYNKCYTILTKLKDTQ